MELAEKGNNLNIDMTNEDATAAKDSESKQEQGLYSALHDMDVRPMFLWGQAVGKNRCKLSLIIHGHQTCVPVGSGCRQKPL